VTSSGCCLIYPGLSRSRRVWSGRSQTVGFQLVATCLHQREAAEKLQRRAVTADLHCPHHVVRYSSKRCANLFHSFRGRPMGNWNKLLFARVKV